MCFGFDFRQPFFFELQWVTHENRYFLSSCVTQFIPVNRIFIVEVPCRLDPLLAIARCQDHDILSIIFIPFIYEHLLNCMQMSLKLTTSGCDNEAPERVIGLGC